MKLLKSVSGQDLVEYILIVILVVLVLWVAIRDLRDHNTGRAIRNTPATTTDEPIKK